MMLGPSGLADLANEPGSGADGGQGVKWVRVAEAAADDGKAERDRPRRATDGGKVVAKRLPGEVPEPAARPGNHL